MIRPIDPALLAEAEAARDFARRILSKEPYDLDAEIAAYRHCIETLRRIREQAK